MRHTWLTQPAQLSHEMLFNKQTKSSGVAVHKTARSKPLSCPSDASNIVLDDEA